METASPYYCAIAIIKLSIVIVWQSTIIKLSIRHIHWYSINLLVYSYSRTPIYLSILYLVEQITLGLSHTILVLTTSKTHFSSLHTPSCYCKREKRIFFIWLDVCYEFEFISIWLFVTLSGSWPWLIKRLSINSLIELLSRFSPISVLH